MENMIQKLTLSDFMTFGKIAFNNDGTCTVIVNLKNEVIKVKNFPTEKRSSFEIIEDAYRTWMERDDPPVSPLPQTH